VWGSEIYTYILILAFYCEFRVKQIRFGVENTKIENKKTPNKKHRRKVEQVKVKYNQKDMR
jgi:hypothetical protein